MFLRIVVFALRTDEQNELQTARFCNTLTDATIPLGALVWLRMRMHGIIANCESNFWSERTSYPCLRYRDGTRYTGRPDVKVLPKV